jgi:hypothetical protein
MLKIYMLQVLNALERVAARLEELEDPAAVQFRIWAEALKERFSETLVQEIWIKIQPIRAHMGYLDYSDENFNRDFDDLLRSMEFLIAELRKTS